MLAEVTSDVNLYEYAEQALLFLLVLGGGALFLGKLVLGETSVSSSSPRSRKRIPLPDSLDTSSAAKEQQAAGQAKLMPPLTPGKARERRASIRRAGNPIAILVMAGEAARAEPGLVINRSQGGLLLSVPCPMAVGTILQIRACQAPQDFPWIQVQVRHCVAKGERWHLGCQFAEALPWSVLLLFG